MIDMMLVDLFQKANEFCLVDSGDLGPYTRLNNPLADCDTDCVFVCACGFVTACMMADWG